MIAHHVCQDLLQLLDLPGLIASRYKQRFASNKDRHLFKDWALPLLGQTPLQGLDSKSISS
eukprot:1157224-Pelagomonas_calceolata.AAC.13